MYTLTLTSDIFRVADSALIPATASNIDYQQYLAWVALGNTPGPYVPPGVVAEITLNSNTIVFKPNGAEAFRINSNQSVTGLKVTDLNSGPLAGFRNKIINGGFDVWQRGTSGFSLNSYCADRWYTDVGTSVSRSTDVPPGFAYSAKHTGVTSAYAAYRTGIELPGTGVQGEYYDGATFTFSCLCKTSVAGKTLILYSAFTTAVSVAGSRTVSSIDIGTTSTSWTKYTYTFTIPTGASIATAKCLEVTPYVNAPNCDVYITGVQLEPGSVATPFESRPYSVELALCQRYYQRIDQDMGWYVGAGGGTLKTPIMHPEMRVTPSWSTVAAGTLVGATSASLVSTSPHSAAMSLVSTAGAGTSTITGRVWESVGTEL